MNVKKIELGWVAAKDIEKAKDFFTNTVGLTLQQFHKEYNWMELTGSEGGARLGVGFCKPGELGIQPGQNAVMTFTVDDIAAKKADFEQKGVTLLGDIIEVPGHCKLLFFQDPDGNLYQLVEQLG